MVHKSSAVAKMGDHGHNRHGPKIGWLLCPFWGELGCHLTQSPEPRPICTPSDILIHQAVWPQQGSAPFFGEGSWVPI